MPVVFARGIFAAFGSGGAASSVSYRKLFEGWVEDGDGNIRMCRTYALGEGRGHC